MSTSRNPSPFSVPSRQDAHALLDGLNRSRPPNARAVSEHPSALVLVGHTDAQASIMPSTNPDPSAPTQVRTKANPTPLDVIFILFASVALVVLILSFSPVRGAEPFQNIPDWLVKAVSNFWNRLFVGAGALGSLALRKWIDRSPAPNYLVWISVFTVGVLGAMLFSAALAIPPPAAILTATIDEPRKELAVTRRTFLCRGHATGVTANTHLWLVIEAKNHVWPKERELHVLADGSWESTVYEDGATDKFSLAIYSANPEAEKFINDWIEAGKRTGGYKELGGIPGTERVARVDDLRLKPKLVQ
jgi:hypothetical protein